LVLEVPDQCLWTARLGLCAVSNTDLTLVGAGEVRSVPPPLLIVGASPQPADVGPGTAKHLDGGYLRPAVRT
jgi:hypothetical protein